MPYFSDPTTGAWQAVRGRQQEVQNVGISTPLHLAATSPRPRSPSQA